MEPNSRVKTVDTACDKLLSQKINLASKLAEVLYTAGASRVTIRDLRESPHSGYRADTGGVKNQRERGLLRSPKSSACTPRLTW